MSAIIPFDFETQAVRVVVVDDAPWFVAADVCRVLDLEQVTRALERLDEDEVRVINLNTLTSSEGIRGNPNMNVVSESGLYALIFTSRKDEAKAFRKWVTAEVLPSIRRDGVYRLPKSEMAVLQAKREFFKTLPEKQRVRAEKKAAALHDMEKLIEEGYGNTNAVIQAAEENGISPRTLWEAKRRVFMVAPSDYEAANAPQWRLNNERGMLSECHPDAMIHWFILNRDGGNVDQNYIRLVQDAKANGWSPIPSGRTMRRVLERVMPRPKAAKSGGK